MSGNSLKSEIEALPEWLFSRASTLAVYSSKPFRKDVDIVLEFVPHPRAFEWNIFHHKVISRSCISLEGMIKKGEPKNNKNGMNFRYIPSGIIDTIVSCQNKSKRQEVESLLAERGVSYRELVMSDSENNVMTLENLIKFKVDKFTNSASDLFIEDDSYQARLICREAKKPVFCLSDNCMYNPGDELGSRFIKNKVKSLMWKVVNSKVRKQGLFL